MVPTGFRSDAAERPGLREFQVVGIARGLLAHEAGLFADKRQVRLAALAGRLLGVGGPCLVRHRQGWLQRRRCAGERLF